MVVVFFFLPFWETIGDGGAPADEELFFFIIVEGLGCPYVDSGGFVFHDGNEALFRPVDEVFGGGVAEAFVAFPGGSPDEVEGAIGALADAGVTEDVATYGGGEEGSVEISPLVAVVAVEEVQAVFSGFAEGCEEVDFRCAGGKEDYY